MKKKIWMIVTIILLVAALAIGGAMLWMHRNEKAKQPSDNENTAPRLSHASLTLLVGESKQIQLYNCTEAPTFESRNVNVATVDNEGVVCAVGKGQAEIVCVSAEVEYICYVFVNEKGNIEQVFPSYEDTELPDAALSVSGGYVDEYVTTTLYVSDFPAISALSVELAFDSRLEFVKCIALDSGIDYTDASVTDEGKLTVGALSYTTNGIKGAQLLQLVFKIKDDFGGNIANISFVESDFNMFVYVEKGSEKMVETALHGSEIEILS